MGTSLTPFLLECEQLATQLEISYKLLPWISLDGGLGVDKLIQSLVVLAQLAGIEQSAAKFFDTAALKSSAVAKNSEILKYLRIKVFANFLPDTLDYLTSSEVFNIAWPVVSDPSYSAEPAILDAWDMIPELFRRHIASAEAGIAAQYERMVDMCV